MNSLLAAPASERPPLPSRLYAGSEVLLPLPKSRQRLHIFVIEIGQPHHLVMQAARERVGLVEHACCTSRDVSAELAPGATEHGATTGRPVQRRLSDDRVPVARVATPRIAKGTHADLSAVQSPIHVVVRLFCIRQAPAAQRKGGEVPCRPTAATLATVNRCPFIRSFAVWSNDRRSPTGWPPMCGSGQISRSTTR